MPRFRPLRYTDDITGMTIEEVLEQANTNEIAEPPAPPAPPVPWTQAERGKYGKQYKRYMNKYCGKPCILKKVEEILFNSSDSVQKERCKHIIYTCFLRVRNYWCGRARVKYLALSGSQEPPHRILTSDISRSSLRHFGDGAFVELEANTTGYDSRGRYHPAIDALHKPSVFYPAQCGTPNNPWLIDMFTLNKGLGLALKDFPHLAQNIENQDLTFHQGQVIVQYSIFGKLTFSIN